MYLYNIDLKVLIFQSLTVASILFSLGFPRTILLLFQLSAYKIDQLKLFLPLNFNLFFEGLLNFPYTTFLYPEFNLGFPDGSVMKNRCNACETRASWSEDPRRSTVEVFLPGIP